jgi:hypothetical protein
VEEEPVIRIKQKDIAVTPGVLNGFTLSYSADDGQTYRQRYIGYGEQEAKRRFIARIAGEPGESQQEPALTREDALLGALQTICGGDREAARKLLGNS